MKTCGNCNRLCFEGASFEYPYPSIWCGAGEWDGVASTDELNELVDCDYWEPAKRHVEDRDFK